MRFNVNSKVRVRLTKVGLDALKADHDALRRQFPKIGDFREPETDADGWSEWQLWSLMQQLGPIISLGGLPPFETEIDIPEPSAG